MENKITLNYSVGLGDYVRMIRLKKGYSQYYMANALDISQNSYCLLENGQTKFVLDRIIQIATIFDLGPQEFLEDFFKRIE